MTNARDRKKLFWTAGLGVVLGALALWAIAQARSPKRGGPDPTLALAALPAAPPSPTAPVRASKTIAPSVGHFVWPIEGAQAWKGEFNSAGRLVSVRGSLGQGPRGLQGFDPSDAAQVRARAEELLKMLSSGLGVRPDSPLRESSLRAGRHSAQIFYEQTLEGAPVRPDGQVSLDIGPEGELLGLDSSYRKPPALIADSGSRVLDEAQARQAVESELSTPLSGRLGAGRFEPVVWVTPAGSGVRAFYAQTRGFEVVVDASSGKVLHRRDRRME